MSEVSVKLKINEKPPYMSQEEYEAKLEELKIKRDKYKDMLSQRNPEDILDQLVTVTQHMETITEEKTKLAKYLNTLETRIQRVRDYHEMVEAGNGQFVYCKACSNYNIPSFTHWPCPTIKDLDGLE